MPLFSVIVPVYNAEQTIEKCINSILTQSIQNFELILVDDGSEDNSFSICNNYSQKDSRVIFKSQNNRGVSSARNEGIKASSGEYIVFVDSDDYVDENYLQSFVSGISIDLIVCGYKIDNKYHEVTKTVTYENETINIQEDSARLCKIFVEGRLNTVWGKAIKRSLIVNNHLVFNETLNIGEDTLFIVNALNYASSITFICDTQYHYTTQREGSITTNTDDITMINVLEKVNTMVDLQLSKIVGSVSSKKSVSLRIGYYYKALLYKSIYQYDEKKDVIKHLYKQYWFTNSLKYINDLYSDENTKFQAILNTKRFWVIDFYMKYNRIKGIKGYNKK